MTIVKEALDALKVVSEAIDNIKTISEAIRDGKEYVKTQHPEVAGDVAAMCEQMRNSLTALASASSIITHFRFVLGDDLSAEAARFNQHLIAHKSKAEQVRQQLMSMRGHCHIIHEHADKISASAGSKGLKSVFAVFGLHSADRERQLSQALGEIYDEEMEFYRNVDAMTRALEASLAVVQTTLGPPGVLDPGKVPAAAGVLGEHAVVFADLESQCNYTALELQSSIDTLAPGSA